MLLKQTESTPVVERQIKQERNHLFKISKLRMENFIQIHHLDITPWYTAKLDSVFSDINLLPKSDIH